ncbi:MAG: hypothetical protein E7320_09165 [Clostridiales bacterium]|nr:hypothetical protein [Clostridiales bacterium]
MKSKFFKDTQGLGECYTRCPPGQINICLRMDREVYGRIVREAGRLGITSGAYIQRMLEAEREEREPPAIPASFPAGRGSRQTKPE